MNIEKPQINKEGRNTEVVDCDIPYHCNYSQEGRRHNEEFTGPCSGPLFEVDRKLYVNETNILCLRHLKRTYSGYNGWEVTYHRRLD